MAGETEGGPGPGPESPPRVPEREQPAERREEQERREPPRGGPDSILAQVQAMENYNREMNRRLLDRRLNQLLQNPTEQEKFNRDPERYLAEVETSEEFKREQESMGTRESILEQVLGNLERARSDPRLGHETVRRRGAAGLQDREPRPGWQWVEVKSSVGIPRYVEMPIADEGKRYYVSEVLARIEATPEAEGGFTDRLALEETALAITAIIENPEKYSRDKDLGKELKKIFLARLRLHGVYQQFSKAPTAKDVLQVLAPVTAEELNTLFKEIPEVRKAFMLLEARAEEFLGGSEKDRKDIIEKIANETVGEKPDIEYLRDIDHLWAERIAERLWEITGRRAIRDRLIPSELEKDKNPEEALNYAYNRQGEVIFLSGGATAGRFYLRRALQFKRYARQTSGLYRPFFQLLDGWDLGAKDVFTRLVETTYETKRKENFGNKSMTLDEKEGLANKVAEFFKDKNGNPLPYTIDEKGDVKWPMMVDWEEIPRSEGPKMGERRTHPYANHLQNIDWSEVDFNTIGGGKGTYPLLEWALYYISYPDDARGTLLGQDELFLQNPTYESLKKTANAFVYLGARANEVKEVLFTNYLNFAGMEYQQALGKRNLSKIELDREIGHAVVDKFIRDKKANDLREELFELRIPGFGKPIRKAWLREFQTFRYSLSWLGGLWGLIKEFIKAVFTPK